MLYDQQAEMSVLGAMMHNNEAGDTALAMLQPNDFMIPAHQVIFNAMCWLRDREMPIDMLTVRTELRDKKSRFGNELEEVGGVDYLVTILDEPPVISHCEQYCRIIKGLSEKRSIVGAAKEILARAEDATADELRAYVEGLNFTSASVPKMRRLYHFRGGKRSRGVITTGYPKLDAFNHERKGGYMAGQLVLIEAYHKTGKTTFALNSAMRILKEGFRVCYATFADLTGEDVDAKLMYYLCGWSHEPDSDSLLATFRECQDYLDELDLMVYDVAGLDSGCNVESFIATFKAEHNKKPFDILFCDYAQEISTSEKTHSRTEEQRIVANKLRLLAAWADIPVVVGSQITEGKEGERDRSKDSRAWEEKAGWVLRLKREAGEKTRTLVQSPISRFGGSGLETVMDYEISRGRYTEADA